MENQMMQIMERENEIIRQMKKTKSEGGKIYCLGAGEQATVLKTGTELNGMTIDAFLVSKRFFSEGNSIDGIPVLCLEDVAIKSFFSPKDLLVVCIFKCDNGLINRYRNELTICKEDVRSLWTVDLAQGGNLLDYDFLSAHREGFESLFRELADDRSRVCMEAFLNQKISGKLKYLDKVYDDWDYCDSYIIDFNKIESYIDCGAFDGDSYLAFREAYQMNTGKEFCGTAYLLEPDADNYQKMAKNCSHARNDIRLLQCGAWHEQGKLFFDSTGTMGSRIAESGMVSIDVNSIDNIVEGKRVDFIKMDIEGSEMNALKGARKTIETYKPILAICVYHKSDDLLTIPAYIRSICPDYNFYIRAYNPYATDLILYAVCG